MLEIPEIKLSLQDDQWAYEYTDHQRQIARAIVVDEDGWFYFIRAQRDDAFGNCALIETSGGGVEDGEKLTDAIRRELKEELGAETEILCKIGVVEDDYNLIHRHNVNHYFLCRALAFGEKHLTEQEKTQFRLTTLKLRYEDAVREYEACANTKLGKLLYRRELPILQRAQELLKNK